MINSWLRVALLSLMLASLVQANPQTKAGATLNLNNVDIRTLIETVALLTRKHFIIDPRVQGQVTVVSNTPVADHEIYEVFLAVLDVHGFIAAPTGNSIKIMPKVNSRMVGAYDDASTGQPQDAIVTRVVSMAHVSAAQVIPIIRPLLPKEAHLAAYTPSNMVILSATARNSQRMQAIIQRIDQPVALALEVIPLQHANAEQMVNIINSLGLVTVAGGEGGQRGSLVMADARTNSLIVNSSKQDRPRVRALIAHLDIPAGSDRVTTQVVYLQYAQAKSLASILTAMVSATTSNLSLETRPVAGVTIQAEPHSNALVIKATNAQMQTLMQLIRQLDIPVNAGSDDIRVVYLKYAQAEAIAPVISNVAAASSQTAGATGRPAPNVSVQAEPQSNALVISAPASTMPTLMTLIRQLDVRRAQVLVEAIIAEVSATKAAELGMQWALAKPDQVGAITSFSGSGPNLIQLKQNPLAVGNGMTMGIGRFAPGQINLATLLNALATDGATNIISTPSLMTLDNEAAEIVVGQNVPFITGQYNNSSSTSGSSTSPFQTIQRSDVGLSLKIRPRINQGKTIQLDIEQEISSINAQSNNAADIVTNKRSIKTKVMANDQDLIILGGLIDDNLQETLEKVPILGDLPIIGLAFKHRKSRLVKRNLMVFIRPTIVRDAAVMQATTQGKYDSLRTRQLLQPSGIELLPRSQRPVLKAPATRLPIERKQTETQQPSGSQPNGDRATDSMVIPQTQNHLEPVTWPESVNPTRSTAAQKPRLEIIWQPGIAPAKTTETLAVDGT
jgi:general secretion pathway protein D